MNLQTNDNSHPTVVGTEILHKIFLGIAVICFLVGTINISLLLYDHINGIDAGVSAQWPIAYSLSAISLAFYKFWRISFVLKKLMFYVIALVLPFYIEIYGSGVQSALAITTFFAICSNAISSRKHGYIYATLMFTSLGVAHFIIHSHSETPDDAATFQFTSSMLIGSAIIYIVSFYIEQIKNTTAILQQSLEVGGIGMVRREFGSNVMALGTSARELLGFNDDTLFVSRNEIYDLMEDITVRHQIEELCDTQNTIDKTRLRMAGKDMELSRFATKDHGYWLLRDISKDIQITHALRQQNEELEIQREQLEYLINHDHLTKVMSRRGINEKIREHYQEKFKTYSILLVDLDYFKHVNDTYGHQAGDFVLVQIAKIISDTVANQGHVGRMGGEEFMVVTGLNLLNASILADNIKDAVSAYRFKISNENEHTIRSTCSIGVAGYDKTFPDDIIKFADTALSYAKDTGRNRVVTANRNFMLQLEQRGELITLQDIEEAIEEGAIQYYVQPIINTQREEVIGFEALLRWEGTFLSPQIWIKKLDIVINNNKELAHKLHREAIHTATLVKAYFPHAYISFNMNLESFAHNLAYHDFIEKWTMGEAATSGLTLNDIVVEIVEDEANIRCNQDMAMANMRILHERGVTFALDDFGKASSNIGRLQTFPVDVLKIDKQFVDDILDSDSRAYKSLVKIAELSHDMDIKVIVEGIETDAHAKVCESLGLYNHQGWLYSKAIPNHQVKHFKIRKKIDRENRDNIIPFISPADKKA